MYQTLLHIPHGWHGIPVFGWGWVLWLWIIFAGVVLVASAKTSNWQSALREWGPFLGAAAAVILFLLPAIELKAIGEDGRPVPDGIAIRGYGVMMGLGILGAIGLASYRARQHGMSGETVMGMATWLVTLGLLGGRLFYLIQFWDEFRQPNLGLMIGDALNLTQGGLVVYGAFFGGFVGFVIYTIRHRLNFLATADVVVPSLMVGLALGRIGCFMNGCCYGGPTDQWWGVQFPPESVPYREHMRTGQLLGLQLGTDDSGEFVTAHVVPGLAADRAGMPDGARILSINDRTLGNVASSDVGEIQEEIGRMRPLSVTTKSGTFDIGQAQLPPRTRRIQPTQLYSAITAGLICVFLLAVEPFLSKPGQLLAMWLTLYPPARFLLEVIRSDGNSIGGTGLTIAQLVSLLVVGLGIALWIFVGLRSSTRHPDDS